MQIHAQTPLSRRGFLGALGAAMLTPALSSEAEAAIQSLKAKTIATAPRFLRLVNSRTGETFSGAYCENGKRCPVALSELNYLLRDVRCNSVRDIDVRTLDIVSKMQQILDTSEPFTVISGYRTPATNEMLRERGGGGVAKHSYHMKGMAIDLRLKSRSIEQIRRAALSLRAGGVGYYPESNFVHVDSGPLRKW